MLILWKLLLFRVILKAVWKKKVGFVVDVMSHRVWCWY